MESTQARQSFELHQLLVNHFNLEELKELCFILDVRFDDLEGQTLSAKALALRTYLERRGRLPQLLEQLSMLRPKVGWASVSLFTTESDPPYKGLSYFRETDSEIFYGRESLTAELVTFLANHRFMAVVGASGSGKSSLVRAGVVPALRSGAIKLDQQTSASWPIYIFTPGEEPVKSLAASLTYQSESVTAMKTLIDDLRADSQSLDLWLYRLFAQQPETHIAIIVDQFEEVFTQCDDPEERNQFIENLAQAVRSTKQGRLTLIIVLRADFYSHALQYEALRPLLETGQKIVGPMSSAELRQAIEGPASAKGWQFEPGLVDLILRDLGATEGYAADPGALPFLSHALLEAWRYRDGRMMTLAGYQAAGGVHGAIAATADKVYGQLPTEQQAYVRRIFLRLVVPGRGTEDTRRRAQLSELLSEAGDAEEGQAVLYQLVDKRLLSVNNETIEVAHEALIRAWPKLRKWLDENRAGLRIQLQLAEDVQAWQELNRDPGALYRGLRLVQAEAWAMESSNFPNELERLFLAVSRASLIAEEKTQREAKQRARRTPAYSLLGGALGVAVSFLVVASPTVENPGLLLVLTLFRLVAGGLAGLFLIFLTDLAVDKNGGRNRAAWLWGGLIGSGIFALLLYFDNLLSVSSPGAELIPAAAAGAVWGLPAGIGRVWMLKDRSSVWRILILISVFCGIVLVLARQFIPALSNTSVVTTFFAGMIVPLAILISAQLADPGSGESKNDT